MTSKPVRVRKARISSLCPGCGHLILRGEQIVSVHHGPWRCMTCHARQREPRPAS